MSRVGRNRAPKRPPVVVEETSTVPSVHKQAITLPVLSIYGKGVKSVQFVGDHLVVDGQPLEPIPRPN